MGGKIWEAPIQQALNEHCIPRLSANTVLKMSNLGYNAELIGAAALVMEHYDKVPQNPKLKKEKAVSIS